MFGLGLFKTNNDDQNKKQDNSKKEEPVLSQIFEIRGDKLGDYKVVQIDDNGNGYKNITITNTR